MRAETLSDAAVVGYLNEHFLMAWSNLLPALYGNADPNAPPPPGYESQHVASLPEGAGGGNIRLYFCTPRGELVHQVVGYWKKDRLLAEARFAVKLLERNIRRAHAAQTERRRDLDRQHRQALAALPPEPRRNDPAARRAAQLGVRLRAVDEVLRDWHRNVEQVIERRREEVYTKGAVGCDF
jgi:hypothetical protein